MVPPITMVIYLPMSVGEMDFKLYQLLLEYLRKGWNMVFWVMQKLPKVIIMQWLVGLSKDIVLHLKEIGGICFRNSVLVV